MGQNQSTPIPVTPKGPPPRPTDQPKSKLLSQLGPQGPSYVSPENKVLPFVLPPSAKSLLRPVSQELSDYHPEYKEIFRSDSLDNEGNITNGNVVNDNSTSQYNGQYNGQDLNGNVSSNGHIPGLDNRSGNQRPVSMYTNGSPSNNNNYTKGHRRQMSASSSLYSKENTIIEHPDEPRYSDDSRNKKVTLPAKSTFDMPYSENLTYAQLAEYRRNQTLAELERKTGKKIEDLSAYEVKPSSSTLERTPSLKSAKSTKSNGPTPVKKKSRAPAPPSQPSKSAPSTPRGTNMSSPPPRPTQPPPPILKSYSVDREPPADYEYAEPRKSVYINRSASLANGGRKPVQPSPPNAPQLPPPPMTGILRNAKNRTNKSMSELPRSQSTNEFIRIRSPPVRQESFNKPKAETEQNKFLSEIQKAAETRAMRRQNSEPATMPNDFERKFKESMELSEDKVDTNSFEVEKHADQPALQTSKQAPPPVAMKPNRSSATSFERQNSVTSESSLSNSIQSSGSNGDQSGAIRRLNSLLQHDIKLAAQAKATKIVKHATPVKEKPKDPGQVFREQLAKAAYERDSRAKTGISIDEQLKAAQAEEKRKDEANIVFYTDQVTVKRTDSIKKQNETIQNKINNDTNDVKTNKQNGISAEIKTPKEVITFKKEEISKAENVIPKISRMTEKKGEIVRHPRQMIPDSETPETPKDNYQNSVYGSKDWTPELDLDSDDNISDSEIMTSSLGKSNGFKSTVVPSKVNDMNYKGKKQKGKERKFKKHVESDEKKKYGSIKKFKTSVHKSVMNAFGSISKASGKVLKKSKSGDLDQVDDVPKNWTFNSSDSSTPSYGGTPVTTRPTTPSYNQTPKSRPTTPSFSGTPVVTRPTLVDGTSSNRAYKYMVPNGYQDHESSSESDEESMVAKMTFESNGHDESNDDSDQEDDHDQGYLKRAGVAYVSKSGQIVVLPEYDKVPAGYHGPDEYDNHAPKIKSKKKKFTFDATVRRKEREQLDEKLSMDTAEKEKHREEERRKEIEAEMEIKRTRELEARERLQRLEMQAQMHQQILQQQQQFGMLSAPPLPPPNGFQQGYNPIDYSQLFAQQSGYGLPFGTPSGYGTPVYNNSVPNMSYDLSEYMRMMGVQNSSQNSQPYTYMLNGGMNWPQATLLAYQSKLQQQQPKDDSKSNQVYQTWTGPKKVVKSSSDSQSAKNIDKNNSKMTTRVSVNSADESDSSAGLSPQRTDASLSASKNNLNKNDDTFGYKSQISVTTVYTPGFNKSASTDNGSVINGNNTDR